MAKVEQEHRKEGVGVLGPATHPACCPDQPGGEEGEEQGLERHQRPHGVAEELQVPVTYEQQQRRTMVGPTLRPERAWCELLLTAEKINTEPILMQRHTGAILIDELQGYNQEDRPEAPDEDRCLRGSTRSREIALGRELVAMEKRSGDRHREGPGVIGPVPPMGAASAGGLAARGKYPPRASGHDAKSARWCLSQARVGCGRGFRNRLPTRFLLQKVSGFVVNL